MEVTDEIIECDYFMRFPNREDVTLCFTTNIGASGLPGIGFSHAGFSEPVAVGYATGPEMITQIITVLSHMLAKAHHIKQNGTGEELAKAALDKKPDAEVIPLFGRKEE